MTDPILIKPPFFVQIEDGGSQIEAIWSPQLNLIPLNPIRMKKAGFYQNVSRERKSK